VAVTPEDLARTLIRRHAARFEEWRRRGGELRRLLAEDLARAHAEGRLGRAWLIGSLAWGSFGERSDVDVVVEGLDREHEGALREELEERLGVSVDLMRLETLPARFRERVLAEGILVA
jgi:predicted nucleotidyltransferase